MATFQIFKSTVNGQFYFHLRATGNHAIILRGEGYTTKEKCIEGINSVKANAPFDSRYEKKVSTNYQHYFNLKATNDQIIGTSETYVWQSDRDRAIVLVKTQAPGAIVEDKTGVTLSHRF